jgi:hypothetical protein
VKAVVAVVAGALASLVAAAPAPAFTAPELYVRQQPWTTHEAVGGWIPLASAPKLNYLAGYQIGYKLQDSGVANNFQRVALVIAAVPDGQPTQPSNATPYCVGRAGTAGTIVDAGPELQFEGDGIYKVKVSVGPGSGGPTDCLSGPTTTASFSVITRVGATLVGSPLVFRAAPLPGDPFVGLRAADPPGGFADISCALNAAVQPDGSVKGTLVVPDLEPPNGSFTESVFTRPGAWTCAARGVAEGRDLNYDSVFFGTPWSDPLTFDVRSDFRRRTGRLSHRHAKRPRFTFRAEFPAAADGGRARVTLFRVKGCKRRGGYKLRKGATFHSRFGARNMRLRIRRPRAQGYYLGRFRFAGTRFIRAGEDPNPMLLLVKRRGIEYVPPLAFPRC